MLCNGPFVVSYQWLCATPSSRRWLPAFLVPARVANTTAQRPGTTLTVEMSGSGVSHAAVVSKFVIEVRERFTVCHDCPRAPSAAWKQMYRPGIGTRVLSHFANTLRDRALAHRKERGDKMKDSEKASLEQLLHNSSDEQLLHNLLRTALDLLYHLTLALKVSPHGLSSRRRWAPSGLDRGRKSAKPGGCQTR